MHYPATQEMAVLPPVPPARSTVERAPRRRGAYALAAAFLALLALVIWAGVYVGHSMSTW